MSTQKVYDAVHDRYQRLDLVQLLSSHPLQRCIIASKGDLARFHKQVAIIRKLCQDEDGGTPVSSQQYSHVSLVEWYNVNMKLLAVSESK